MKEIYKRLFIGNDTECRTGDDTWAVVHACKSPCHQRGVGYTGSLPKGHPNYLILEKQDDLYLNIIDPPVPLFMPELFVEFMEFAGVKWDAGKAILIHCNQGESRAPSLGMLFMAKHIKLISGDSFDTARDDFLKIFPRYTPGLGIQAYLRKHWVEF